MARESKAEGEVRDSIAMYLAPEETIREFTWGTKNSTSVAFFFFGFLGRAFAKHDQAGFFIGLTDKHVILVEVKGKMPNGDVHNISLSDIKGFSYIRGPYSGTLNIHLTAEALQLNFDSKPWYPRAQNMAKIMPLPR